MILYSRYLWQEDDEISITRTVTPVRVMDTFLNLWGKRERELLVTGQQQQR